MTMHIGDKNQRGRSAVFEARDCSADAHAVFGERKSAASGNAVFEAKDPAQEAYKGAERRRGHRRGHDDRRLEMRFDMDKPDRRDCAGRRGDDKRPNFW
jgi:hypothetical protein